MFQMNHEGARSQVSRTAEKSARPLEGDGDCPIPEGEVVGRVVRWVCPLALQSCQSDSRIFCCGCINEIQGQMWHLVCTVWPVVSSLAGHVFFSCFFSLQLNFGSIVLTLCIYRESTAVLKCASLPWLLASLLCRKVEECFQRDVVSTLLARFRLYFMTLAPFVTPSFPKNVFTPRTSF